MRFTTTIISFLTIASFAAAQTSTSSAATSTSTCAAQNILDACLQSTKPQLNDCAANDWKCLCTQIINVLTCYNNCPNDPGSYGVSQQKTAYCDAYSATATISTPSATASTTAASSTSSVSSTQTTAPASGATGTTSATASASSKAAAADLTMEPSTVFAAVAIGLLAAL